MINHKIVTGDESPSTFGQGDDIMVVDLFLKSRKNPTYVHVLIVIFK